MLPKVSAQRREQALKFKHVFGQWACLKSWLMVAERTGGQDWLYNEYGKPYVAGGLAFSISHCKDGIAVAVDDRPLGIDIESIRDIKPELVERTMNEAEQAYIGNSAARFTELWTKKEAFLKYKGTGIIDDLREVLHDTGKAMFETTIKETYIYTVCYEKN